jgi:hypothetical protein
MGLVRCAAQHLWITLHRLHRLHLEWNESVEHVLVNLLLVSLHILFTLVLSVLWGLLVDAATLLVHREAHRLEYPPR